MKVGKVKNLILKLWEAEQDMEKTSVLLLGAPGVGKSTLVREAAEEYAEKHGLQFIEYTDDVAKDILSAPQRYFVFVDLRLTEIEAADLSGIPRDVDGAVTYKPLLWVRVLSRAKGVLFLDELTNENDPNKLAAAYKLVLDRSAGFIRFNDDVFIVAAGNSPEHSAVANQLPAPLINRLLVIEVTTPSVDEWKKWMMQKYGDAWDIRTYAFLKAFETDGYLLRTPQDPETLINYPTPRSWTKLALMLKAGFDNPEVITGLIGPEAGTRFKAFINTKIDINALIKDPESFRTLNLDQQYMAALVLSGYLAKPKNIDKAIPLIKVMHSISPEFVVVTLLFMDDKRKVEQVIKRLYQVDKAIFGSLIEVVELKQRVRR